MKNLKKTNSQTPYYFLLALIASLLCAALLSGCHIYRHEEVEMIRCPVIENDTIYMPDWEHESVTPEF